MPRKPIPVVPVKLRKTFIRAFTRMASVSESEVRKLAGFIDRGEVDLFIRALGLDEPITEEFARMVIYHYLESGKNFLAGVKFPPDPETGFSIRAGFSAAVPRAAAWTDKAIARLVTEVSENQKRLVRQEIAEAVGKGLHPRKIVKRIVGEASPTGGRSGGILGLTETQKGYADRAREELRNLDPTYFGRQRRDRRYDAQIRKAMETGKPLTDEQIEFITGRYRSRLLDYRGEMIARTEYHSAVETGKFDSMQAMVDDGKVKAEAVTKVWSSSGHDGKTRESHLMMNNQTQPWDQPFVAPDQSLMRFPGDRELGASGAETINCRCIMHVRINRYLGLT